jgi:hypothetical protein
VLLEPRLTRQQVVHLALERILIEQLPAGDPIDFRARLGESVLVRVLHFGLPRDVDAEHVVMERDVERRARGPKRRERQQGRDRPEGQGTERESMERLSSGNRDEIVGARQFRAGEAFAYGHLSNAPDRE